MNLSESDYNRLLPFRKIIRHVAGGGSTSNHDVWTMCNQIKYEHTGSWSRSDCSACKVDLIVEFEIALDKYENKPQLNGVQIDSTH